MDNIKTIGGSEFRLQLDTLQCAQAEVIFEVDASEYTASQLDIVADISIIGRHTSTPINIRLIREPTM